ncbi:MAG: putative Ig domain-containing protein [Planctomycetes bacterium]|nr:putative Ig domain-containing protein [Planctomycetota bacterium]
MNRFSIGSILLGLAMVVLAGTAAAQIQLTTTFASNNGLTTGGNMFNITTGASGITITRFDCNVDATTAGVDWQIYTRTGTFVGFETNAAAWTLHDTITNTTGAGLNNPTNVTLNTPLVLNASTTYGIYISMTTASGINYTNVTTPTNYADSNITITVGSACGATQFSGLITGRGWNGTVYYNAGDPTLVPATGSSFTTGLVVDAPIGVPLSAADLVADDSNTANIDVTVTAVSAAPGVTAPSSAFGVAVPHGLSWTGVPTTTGTYSYTVQLSDGTATPSFNVVINVTDPGPTLTPTGSSNFNVALEYFAAPGIALATADLRVNDANSSTVSVTVTPTAPAPGVTAPGSVGPTVVPFNLSWTGTPTAVGVYSYGISMSDGVNVTNVVVTIDVSVPEMLIGQQTTMSNTIPFNQNSVRFQTVYTAAEVSMPAGTVISEIRVAGSIVAVPQYNGLRCRIAHSNVAVAGLNALFDSNYIGTLQTVFGPADYTPSTLAIGATSQWYVFPLTNPFVYNGTDGLLVDWSYDSKIGTGFTVGTAAPTGETVRGRVYSTSGNHTTLSGTTATTLGNYGLHLLTYPANSVALASAPSAGGLATPQSDLVVMDMRGISIATARTLNSVTFTKSGTISDASLSLVRLIQDNNDDGIVDGGDTVLGSGTLTSGQITFAGSPVANIPDTSTNPPVRLLLAVNIATAQSAGTTLGFEITSASDVTFSGGTDSTIYPVLSGMYVQRMAGTYSINKTSGDYTDIGDAFDDLETFGVSGAVVLEITDSEVYVATPAYSLGISSAQPLPAVTPVPGASATNTITLRAASGQTPGIQGNNNGAVLIGSSSTVAQTGRGSLVINQSYVTVEDIEAFGGPHFGIMAQGNNTTPYLLNTTNITIRRCMVHDIPNGPGIAHMGLNSGWANNFLVEHNFVWNCLTMALATTPALQTLTNGAITIRNTPASNGAIVRHNTVVHTSTLADTGGIYVYNSSGAQPLAECSNNIVVTTSTSVPAIRLGGSGVGSATYAPVVANTNFNYWFASTHCNVTTLATFALWQGTGRDTNGSSANPQLISTAPPFDLRLLPGSPCIDPTGQTSSATIDIFGTTRPQGTTVDIGAHESDYTTGLLVSQNNAGPSSVTTALTTDQWVGTFNAMSVLSIQQVNSVTFTHSGTTGNGSYANLKLWVDANANNQFDVADVQLGSTVTGLTGSTVTFSGSPLGAFTAQNQSLVFFVTAQIAASATPGTAQFRIVASTDVTANAGPVDGNFPVIGKSINVVNPAPTVTPATGSSFNASLVLNTEIGVALSNADLSVVDTNDPTVDITIVAVSAAPGVTTPTNQMGATVPGTVSWVGTPTALGSYSYTVTVDDGTNAPVFNITVNITNPSPTLFPSSGSNFTVTRTYNALQGVTLTAADLVANDVNDPNVSITITAVTPAPGVTQPANQGSAAVPATISWTGTPTAAGNFTYSVVVSDGNTSPSFNVTIAVTNPAPTLVPATPSGFNASRVYNALQGVALVNADLVANDTNDPNVSITITAVTAAPGVTQPSNQASAAVPAGISWTGAPTATGTFTYTVNVNDGTNAPNFTVTINVTNPAPTLVPTTGSNFNATRVLNIFRGTALSNASLDANDANNPTVNVTITAVSAAPGVTQPTDLVNANVPATITWTGTPTALGSYSYTVQVSDGVNSPTFNVTINVQQPPLNGTYSIDQTLTTADFTSVGQAFDALETAGVTGPVILEITDSATYTANISYTLGINASGAAVAVNGVSATNTITLRAAAGQTPKIQGNATGANLQTPLTGRGCLGIMTSYVTVEGIECYDGPNFGILIQGNSTTLRPINNTIRNCIVHDIPDGPGIAYMGQNSSYFENGLIENNFVWNCFTNSVPATTVLLTNTYGSITLRNAASGTGIVRHNTVLHTSTLTTTGGIYAYSSSSTFPIHDLNNNIVVCTSTVVPALYMVSITSAPTIANCDHNFWFASVHSNQATLATFAAWQATGRDTNGSNADPQLASTTAPFDLHLSASSPCIDPAAQTSGVTSDIDGDTRPIGSAVDIGADEAVVPFMEVLQATTPVAMNSNFQAGNVATTTGGSITFTIRNTGADDLLLTGTPVVSVTLNNNLDAASGVTTAPASTTINPNGTTTFVIFIDPTIDAAFDMTISIDNNDADRDPYVFDIQGTGFTPNGEALANTTVGSNFTGGTNGPFSMSVNPGTTLTNADLELTDPESDNITVTSIVAPATVPAGIVPPTIPAAGHPISLSWTGTANAANDPGDYTWQVTFEDAVNQTPVVIDVTITIIDMAPVHAISGASGGTGAVGNPYTATWTETMGPASDIDLASVSDPNTNQVLSLGTIVPGASNPSGGSGFSITLAGGLLNVAPTLSLVALDVGTYTFDVPVTDGLNTVDIAISLTVNAAPSITTLSPLLDGEQGVAYTALQFTATGGTGALGYSITAGALPPGMAFSATGLFNGTPTLQGVYNFTVTITDTLGVSDADPFQITIDPPANGNPTITPTTLVGGIVGNVYGPVTIQATGGTPGYTFAIVNGALPLGLTMTTAGVISGTPTMQGTSVFDIQVTDSAFATDTDTFQITIGATPGGGGGGGSGGGGGGCAGGQGRAPWMLLAGGLAILLIAIRRRRLA